LLLPLTTHIANSQDSATPTSVPPTQTRIPSTSTSTLTSTLTSTPTPSPCDPAIIQIRTATNAFLGPDNTTTVITELDEGLFLPVIARAQYVRWWLVQLSDGRTGWVPNSIVLSYGNTAALPVIDPPDTPHESVEWVIRPNPDCNPTPTPTLTPTPTPLPTPLLLPEPAIDLANPTLANDGIWALPVNLSHSGSATQPKMVPDKDGLIHFFWRDAFAGLVYMRAEMDAWYGPAAITSPFDTATSFRLMFDGQNRLHAFWLDWENTLFYTVVPLEGLLQAERWQTPDLLDMAVIGYQVNIDEQGGVHVVYASQQSNVFEEAGVFYRKMPASSAPSLTWSQPIPLFQTPYLRRPETGGQTTQQIQLDIATGAAGQTIHAVWEVPVLEKVYRASSFDGGKVWQEAVVVDERQPTDSLIGKGPRRIFVHTLPNVTHLIWQAGHGTVNCTQYYQTSYDGGQSWDAATPLFVDLVECPIDNQIIPHTDDQFLMMTNTSERVFISSWEADHWQVVYQNQPILKGFVDQETYRLVQFGCYYALMMPDNELLIAGCDQGDKQDIWLTWRSIETLGMSSIPPTPLPVVTASPTVAPVLSTPTTPAVEPGPSTPGRSGLQLNDTWVVIVASLIFSGLIIFVVGAYRLNASRPRRPKS